jgi:hypothetical protein
MLVCEILFSSERQAAAAMAGKLNWYCEHFVHRSLNALDKSLPPWLLMPFFDHFVCAPLSSTCLACHLDQLVSPCIGTFLMFIDMRDVCWVFIWSSFLNRMSN